MLFRAGALRSLSLETPQILLGRAARSAGLHASISQLFALLRAGSKGRRYVQIRTLPNLAAAAGPLRGSGIIGVQFWRTQPFQLIRSQDALSSAPPALSPLLRSHACSGRSRQTRAQAWTFRSSIFMCTSKGPQLSNTCSNWPASAGSRLASRSTGESARV